MVINNIFIFGATMNNTNIPVKPKSKIVGYILCGLMVSPIVAMGAEDIYSSYNDTLEATPTQYATILKNVDNTKIKPYAAEYKVVVNHALKDDSLTNAEYRFLNNYYHLLAKSELLKTK